MKAPEVRIEGSVTASTATAVTLTKSGSTDAGALGATVTTLVTNGTALAGIAVGDRLEIRIRAH
jgi:hypothetical protein